MAENLPVKVVLIIDADDVVVTTLAKRFKAMGNFKVIKTTDGKEAYRKASVQKFDFICTDITMPGFKGEDLIKSLRDNDFNTETPMLILAKDVDTAKKECANISNKNLTFFAKPVKKEVFIELVKRIVFAPPKKAAPPKAAAPAAKAKVNIDVNFINPFIEGTIKTLNTMAEITDIKPGKVKVLSAGEGIPVDISGTITMISKNFHGIMSIGFPEKTFLYVVNAMMDENFTELNSKNEDAVAELTNVIFGLTKSVLNEKGYSLQKAIPSIVKGADHTVLGDKANSIIAIPFESSAGPFYVLVNTLGKDSEASSDQAA